MGRLDEAELVAVAEAVAAGVEGGVEPRTHEGAEEVVAAVATEGGIARFAELEAPPVEEEVLEEEEEVAEGGGGAKLGEGRGGGRFAVNDAEEDEAEEEVLMELINDDEAGNKLAEEEEGGREAQEEVLSDMEAKETEEAEEEASDAVEAEGGSPEKDCEGLIELVEPRRGLGFGLTPPSGLSSGILAPHSEQNFRQPEKDLEHFGQVYCVSAATWRTFLVAFFASLLSRSWSPMGPLDFLVSSTTTASIVATVAKPSSFTLASKGPLNFVRCISRSLRNWPNICVLVENSFTNVR